ncbi:MAG: zinc ABC transporter substrate-binding protein, partial [Oscillospiraceae bacterium]|nr:zinc ABC transporter substrate-binding protein [Oscillospiraceae bacterium]
CSSETEPSFAAVSELTNLVNEKKVPTVFYLEFSSQSIAQKIADSCGVKTDLLHSCHNISDEDMKKGVTFVDLMTQNYEKLSEALN